MSETIAADEVRAALADFDRAFASGEATTLAELFAVDALLLLQHTEPIEGRPGIRDHWTRLFATYDTGSWRAEHQLVEVHGDHAYSLSIYSETLVHRAGGPSRLVNGRLIRFHRRDPGGSWLVAVAMNSHVRPVELLE